MEQVINNLSGCKKLAIYHTYEVVEITIDDKNFIILDTDCEEHINIIFSNLPNTIVNFNYTSRFPDVVYYENLTIPPSVKKLELTVLSNKTTSISKSNLNNPTHMVVKEMTEDDIKRLPDSVRELDVELFSFQNEQTYENTMQILKDKNIQVNIEDYDYEESDDDESDDDESDNEESDGEESIGEILKQLPPMEVMSDRINRLNLLFESARAEESMFDRIKTPESKKRLQF